MTKVYNKRNGDAPPDAIYCGRPSRWGNPFPMLTEANRDAVCDRFERYAQDRLAREPGWLEPLRGRDLVCFCAPKRCHCDTLLRLANLPEQGQVRAGEPGEEEG